MTRRMWLFPLVLAMALGGAACGDDTKRTTTETTLGETTTALALPKFAADTTMARLQVKGKIVVGTMFNQIGSGLMNPATGQLEGFDIEIAKLIAVGIFGGTVADVGDKVTFKETIPGVRETAILGGDVDMVVGTYTVQSVSCVGVKLSPACDTRRGKVDSAGPYVVDGQTVMVKSDDTTIKALTDLNGKKVCSGTGSTAPDNLKNKQITPSELVLRGTYPECADELRQGRVEAVVTDRGILLGLVASSSKAFKLVGIDLSQETLGIGIKKGDDSFRGFLNTRLEAIEESGEWADAYSRTLGKLGRTTPQPPPVDREGR